MSRPPIPPMPASRAATAGPALDAILEDLPTIVAGVQATADRRGDVVAFAEALWALSCSSPAEVRQLGAAAILELARAQR